MDRSTITLRLRDDIKEALGAIARSMDRDRSYLLNEVVAAYVETHRWQIDHIKEGLRQAEAGEFATEAEVEKAFARRLK